MFIHFGQRQNVNSCQVTEGFSYINLRFLNLSVHIYFHLGFMNINKLQCLRYALQGFLAHMMESERNSLFLFQLNPQPSEFLSFSLLFFTDFFYTKLKLLAQFKQHHNPQRKKKPRMYAFFKNAVLNRAAQTVRFIIYILMIVFDIVCDMYMDAQEYMC